MTTYNVRVSRSDAAEGPFTDYFGKAEKDTTNNFPILTAPYRFENHPGWAGTAHCGVFTDGQGNYFMAHQGRLSPQNQLMVLHIRQLFFTPEAGRSLLPRDMQGLLRVNSAKKIWSVNGKSYECRNRHTNVSWKPDRSYGEREN